MSRVLITAGASGIGLAMAQAFAGRGDDIWVTDVDAAALDALPERSEEHTAELQSRPHSSYAAFCLKKKNHTHKRLSSTRI